MSFTPLVKAKTFVGTPSTAVDTTGAKLFVASLAATSTPPTITDSAGNASGNWVTVLSRGSSPTTYVMMLVNPTTSATHTFSVSGAVASLVIEAYGVTGTGSADTANSQGSISGVAATIGTLNLLPTNPNELIISAHCFAGAITSWAAAAGFAAVDLQPYAGGTNFGVGMVRQIQTTATQINANTQTATWTGSQSSECVTVAFTEIAAASLTLTTPKAFEVHQRSGTTGSIQISGTHVGATEDIEASFNGGAYQTIAVASVAGAFSGTMTGQAQGQGTLTVRKKTTTSASATVAYVGIGENFADGGDSRDEGRGDNAQVYSHATFKAGMFKAGVWAELADSGAGGGTIWPRLATQIMASQGVPVGIIRRGTGGTDVAGNNNSWAKNNGDYAALVSAVTASTVAGVNAALFLLGPNAIVNSNAAAIPLATYRTALDTLASNLAADLPGAPRLFVDMCGEVGTGSPPDPRGAKDNIRGAVLSAWNNNSTAIKGGPVLIEQDYADNVHPTTNTQLQQAGDRYWLALEAWAYGGSNGRGPRIASAAWNLARTQVTVAFDRALKTGLTHATQPWIVNDIGGVGVMTISGVAYHGTDPNALLITVSTAATGAAGATRLTFASGDDAVGRVIPLSTDITLPVGGPIQIPAEPIYAYTVTEVAFSVAPSGLASAAAFGTAVAAFTGGFMVAPSGLASTAAFGMPVVAFGGAFSIAPAGLASSLTFGTPSLHFVGSGSYIPDDNHPRRLVLTVDPRLQGTRLPGAGGALLQPLPLSPGCSLDIEWDWRGLLIDGEALLSYAIAWGGVALGDFSDSAQGDNVVRTWVGLPDDAVDDARGELLCSITTTAGRTDSRKFELLVRQL